MNFKNRVKVGTFAPRSTRFIAEQFGYPENEFKESVFSLLQSQRNSLRCYLARVAYDLNTDLNVAFCIATTDGEDESLTLSIASVFRDMFGLHEHLDIVFINQSQESELRRVCCPFFSSKRFSNPDFYLTSSEGYGFEEIRVCYKLKRLTNGHPDGYILCDLDPPIVGQPYGLGAYDLNQVVIASRFAKCTIFAIDEWPAYVHVARMSRKIRDDKFSISASDIVSIGWAEIYDSLTSARASFQ